MLFALAYIHHDYNYNHNQNVLHAFSFIYVFNDFVKSMPTAESVVSKYPHLKLLWYLHFFIHME